MIELASNDKCTGCFACEEICKNNAVQKTLGEDGFYYPTIDLNKCVQCGKCRQVCPILNIKEGSTQYLGIYAASSKERSTVLSSSSGGVFSELAETVINRRGRVYGAAYDEDFSVYHCSANDVSELWKLRGAKYAQSNIEGVFSEIKTSLLHGELVLFSGCPCQVGGLKQFLGEDFPNLYCVDFICHGVPSPAVWSKYLQYRQKIDSEDTLDCINMRSKESGWKHYKYSSIYGYKSGKIVTLENGKEPFMNLFLQEKINRLSCGNCAFKKYHYSDLTIGDCWGIWDYKTSIENEGGVSILIVNTNSGMQLFKAIEKKLNCEDFRQYDFDKYNPAFIKSFSPDIDRNFIIKRILKGDNSYFENPQKVSLVQRLMRLL